MLKAEREKYAIFVSKLSETAAKDFLLSEHEKLVDALAKLAQANALIENGNRLYTKLNRDYDTLKADYDKALAANEELSVLLQKEQDKEKLKLKAMYGMKSEKIDAIADLAESGFKEPVDESRNEDNAAVSADESKSKASGNKRSGLSVIKGKKKRNRKGETHESRLKDSMNKMPHLITYDFDSEEFDRKYGKWNWRIRGYRIHEIIKKINSPYYVEVIKTPIISVGLEHRLVTERYENPVIPKTHLSSSFMAEILYNKYCLSIPCYRMASYYKAHGLDISRQLIIGWINKCVPNLLGPVYDALKDEGRKTGCNQVDETYFRVNRDGRKPGSKSFMWVHATGELTGGHPSIVFCFEKTRGTDHLRDYYREFSGYIISDAYISYDVLAKESEGRISSAKCMMHCRRNFAIAFFVYASESMSDDQLAALEETKALLLIRDIYQAEEPLRKLMADERLSRRLIEVKPKVDAFFRYIHELAESGKAFSARMNEAIKYALRHESSLREFLNDGTVSLDNGFAERIIRSFSVGRANWLFADTLDGAETTAIMYSIVETAKANGANVEMYLRYLLEEMPKHLDDKDRSFLSDMMPWSEKYKEYENSLTGTDLKMFVDLVEQPEAPKTPRKKDAATEMSA